jgi:hypothetical protein
MKKLLSVVTVAVVALFYTTSLQAQTTGKTTTSATKAGKKNTAAPKKPNLRGCTYHDKVTGAPCI